MMYPPSRRPQGKTLLIILRAASVTASLVFSGLLITTMLIALPGNLEFVPPGDVGDFRYVDGVLYMDTSFTLGNHGYHDITNFTFSVGVVVADSIEVTDYRTPPYDIPIGSRQEIPLSIPLDLTVLQGSPYLVLQPTSVDFAIEVGGTTTRGFLDFLAGFSYQQDFDALVSDFQLDPAGSGYNVTSGEFSIPYSVTSADFLSGNASAHLTLFNQSGVEIGQTNETILLGVAWSDNMTFMVDPLQAATLLSEPQDLTLRVELSLPGGLEYTVEMVIPWDPGGGP